MITLTKLFTESINEQKRKLWMSTVGLDRLMFNYREILPGGLLIRNWEIAGLHPIAHLTSDLACETQPTVTLNHAVHFPIKKIESASCVFENLISFPWVALLSRDESLSSVVSVSDPAFQKGCEAVRESLTKLHSAIQGFELVCIECDQEAGVFLFHTVRNTIVRSGFFRGDVGQLTRPGLGIASVVKLKFQNSNGLNLLPFDGVLNTLSKALETREEKRFFMQPCALPSNEAQIEL